MNLNKDKQNILKYISKPMKENKEKKLPSTSDASYDIFNEAWAISIAVDIRNFKKMVSHYKRWAIIRIIQAFTNSIISAAKESPNFVDAYVNGDEVIVIMKADTKTKISEAYEIIVTINSIANYLLPRLLRDNGFNNEFKAGVGIWLSQNNSLIKYGERRSINHGFFTTMGDSINYSSALAKVANKNGKPQILFNKLLGTNMDGKGAESFKKWGKSIMKINDESVYGYSIRWESYAK